MSSLTKRHSSATPLSHALRGENFQYAPPARKRRRRYALPAQSKTRSNIATSQTLEN
jgi:hypothetical protein